MANVVSRITITDPTIKLENPNAAGLSNIHNPRLIGQGYCTIEDVIDHISSKKSAALEDFLEDVEGGMDIDQAIDNLEPSVKSYLKKMRRWITKWSRYVDDRIRSKYSVPFPDAPFAPEVLNTATVYYVVHALETYEGGHIGARNEAGEPTYYDYAEGIIRKILDGVIHLETEYSLPILDKDGKIIGKEEVSVGITGSIMAQHYTENPLSLGNQDREFGFAVASRFGGSGYKQHGYRGGFSGRLGNDGDYD